MPNYLTSDLDKAGRGYIRVSGAVAQLMAGNDDLSTWDDEELFRGQKRSEKTGNFDGAPPKVVPREAYTEFVRRQMERAEQHFAESVAEAAEALADIATDKDVDENTRLKAIGMLLDRVYGKPKESMEIAATVTKEPWQEIIEDVTIDRGELDDFPQDGESWDDYHQRKAREHLSQIDGRPALGTRRDIVDAEIVDDEPAPHRPGPDATDAEWDQYEDAVHGTDDGWAEVFADE